jgi:pyruvate dehydrogenase E1 component alpha subunit
MLACGMEARGVMAELTGRIGGYSKGKGGSMHMFSREKNFFGGHGIVGAQVSIGAGMGFAHKYKKDGGVCMAYMGDGAANQGQVYESFNMAALWKLPVIFVIENNRYGMGTSVDRSCAGDGLYLRGAGYGIPGEQVNGMDVFAVRDAGARALDHARSGKGPMILEMQTYRYRGHSMSDPAKYRDKQEVDDMRSQHDPIDTLKAWLLQRSKDAHQDIEERCKAIEKDVKNIVNDAADFAQTSPEPAPAELWTDVLLDVTG